MKKVAIIGYGVLGKQLAYFINAHSESGLFVFDDICASRNPGPASNIFRLSDCYADEFKDFYFYIGIGYKHLALRAEIIEKLAVLGRYLPAYVHPSCLVSDNAIIGDACILFPGCNIDQNVRLGSGNILHNSVVLSHDTTVGNSNYFSPSVTICGNGLLGSCIFIGAGSVISDGISIGDNVRIGVGSCITSNVAPDKSVIGNPQRELINTLKLS